MSFVCVKEVGDYLMCNGTRYDLHEEELSYKDTMFWVYLGVYVGLVLFAGEDGILYFHNSVFKLYTSASMVARSNKN